MAFPPYDVGPLALVALTPLLWSWRTARPRHAALYGFVFGLAFFGIMLEWSRYFGVVAIVPLVCAVAAYIAGTGAMVATLARRGIRSPWLTAAAWVLLENLRDRWPLGGLPWGEAGAALHDLPAARALASFGGVALVSFLVVAFNGFLVDFGIAARQRLRRREPPPTRNLADRAWRWSAVGLASVIALTVLADVLRYEPRVTGTLHFALLQGNDQNRNLTAAEEYNQYLTRRHLTLAAQLHGKYDLIVFPESALERDPEIYPELRAQLVAVAAKHDAVLLVNARTRARGGGLHNANLAYDPDGRLQGSYAKQHLVPFGEYVPWRSVLGFIDELRQVPFDYVAGHRRTLFHAGGHKIATVICFESAFTDLVRDNVRDGAEAIVVSTNNRSYRRSGLAAQHLALSQMRAAETARPILHASISGITGVVDSDGDVHDTSRLFVNKVTTGTIHTTTGETPYVRIGNWAVLGSGLALVIAAAVGELNRRRRQGAVLDSSVAKGHVDGRR